jgi:hypothetical protein
MKKYIYSIAIILCSIIMFSGCETEYDKPTFTEDDYPRILGMWPERNGDVLGSMNAFVGEEFSQKMMFTPSGLCEGIWYIDGVEYCRGILFVYTPPQAGSFHVKLEVKTSKYTTTREAILQVRARN